MRHARPPSCEANLRLGLAEFVVRACGRTDGLQHLAMVCPNGRHVDGDDGPPPRYSGVKVVRFGSRVSCRYANRLLPLQSVAAIPRDDEEVLSGPLGEAPRVEEAEPRVVGRAVRGGHRPSYEGSESADHGVLVGLEV